MKKFSLLALAAAGLLLGACSEKDDVAMDTPQNNAYGLVEGESSWIAVGISMPGESITRGLTRANEDLIDGELNEYSVKSGTLYLFTGENENNAKFFGSYPITASFSNESSDNVPDGNSLGNDANNFGEITSTSTKITQEIKNPKLGVNDKLWAYVILNDQTLDGNNKPTGTQITNLGLSAASTTTGADFKAEQLKAIGIENEGNGYGNISTTGLVMTSVPIATKAGGLTDPTGANILTFTEIDKDAIYKTKAEAEADGAQMACIYVERAAVKVEVKLAEDFGIQLDGETTKTIINSDNVKWALGNVNYGGADTGAKGYFNTRKFNTEWLGYWNQQVASSVKYLQYRMVGRTPFFDEGHTPNPAYRTYFAEDPNYTGTGTLGINGLDAYDGLKNYKLNDSQYTLAPDAITYTYENTFDEKSQIYRNTTYVGVKVTIPGGTFYTVEGQPNTKLADITAVGTVVKNRLRNEINGVVKEIQDEINEDLGKSSGRTISADVENVSFDVIATVAFGTSTEEQVEAGEQAITVTLALDNLKTNGSSPSPENVTAINNLATQHLTISNVTLPKVYKYDGGIAYYTARIQHFGDVETPWDADTEAFNNYADQTGGKLCVYPENGVQTIGEATKTFGANRANAWLGRWGIVRNNWYSITLKEITGIGSPVPEDFHGDAGNTPDDNPEPKYYIRAEVHILPWVKRTQSVTF